MDGASTGVKEAEMGRCRTQKEKAKQNDVSSQTRAAEDKENAPAAEKERENASAEMEAFKLLKWDMKSKRSHWGNLEKEEIECREKKKEELFDERALDRTKVMKQQHPATLTVKQTGKRQWVRVTEQTKKAVKSDRKGDNPIYQDSRDYGFPASRK